MPSAPLSRVFLGSFVIATALMGAGCSCDGESVPPDASSDAPRVRQDVNQDATTVVGDDAPIFTGLRSPDRCRIEPDDVYLLGSDTDLGARARLIGVGPSATSFGVVWRESVDGTAQVRFAEIPATSGPPSATQTISEGTSVHDQPTITANGAGYVVAWTDNSADDFEIHARTVAGTTLGAIQRITNRVGRDDSPSLVSLGGGNMLVSWVEERGTMRVPVVRPIAPTAAATGTAHDVSATGNVGQPVLAPREGGAVLLFTDTAGTFPDVILQRLEASGVSMGAREVLSAERDATGDVDVGLTAIDGAAVFGANVGGARLDVRVRLLDGRGTPGRSEYSLNEGEELGDSASVARLRAAVGWSSECRDGYAVAYRSYPGAGAPPVLRLLLISAGAEVVRAVNLSPPNISSQGGRTTLRISEDGQLLVAWTDTREDRVDMRAARIRCD